MESQKDIAFLGFLGYKVIQHSLCNDIIHHIAVDLDLEGRTIHCRASRGWPVLLQKSPVDVAKIITHELRDVLF